MSEQNSKIKIKPKIKLKIFRSNYSRDISKINHNPKNKISMTNISPYINSSIKKPKINIPDTNESPNKQTIIKKPKINIKKSKSINNNFENSNNNSENSNNINNAIQHETDNKINLKIQLKPVSKQKWIEKRKVPWLMNSQEYLQLEKCNCLKWCIPSLNIQDLLILSNICWEMRIFIWEKFKLIWVPPQIPITLYPHQIESLLWMRSCEMNDQENPNNLHQNKFLFKKGKGLIPNHNNNTLLHNNDSLNTILNNKDSLDDNSDSESDSEDADEDEEEDEDEDINKYNSAVVTDSSKLGWRGIRGGILSLRMGLGKTITATSLCLMERKDRVTKLPNLIVVPKTLILEWKYHFQHFYGDRVKVLYYHRDYLTSSKIDNIQISELQQYDFIVTSYDFLRAISNRYELWKSVIEWTETGKRRKILIRNKPDWEDVKWGQFYGPLLFFMLPWKRIICDESQHFANPSTRLFEAMCSLYADHKWCLTGTPMKNNFKDIWAQLRWCGLDFSYKYNRSRNGLRRGYIPTPWTISSLKTYKQNMADGYFQRINIQHFHIDQHNLWKSWMYRGFNIDDRILQYEYKDTNIKLPPLNEVRIPVELSKEEWLIYQEVFDQTIKTFQGYMSGGNRGLNRTTNSGITYANVLAKFTRLRQICIAPHLITLESKREAISGKLKIDQELKKNLNEITKGRENKLRNPHTSYGIYSSKISKTLDIINSIFTKDNHNLDKVLIFTNFLGAIDLLKLALRERMGIHNVLVLDGSSKDRGNIVKKFQLDHSFRILILNYAVGAQGLNLTAGNHVILMNQWWCPTVHKQAVARAWRIGQDRPVKVYKLITSRTIEENMIEKYNNQKIQQIDDLYDGQEVKLDKYIMGQILGTNGNSCINIGYY